jgi:hypothetical protein
MRLLMRLLLDLQPQTTMRLLRLDTQSELPIAYVGNSCHAGLGLGLQRRRRR